MNRSQIARLNDAAVSSGLTEAIAAGCQNTGLQLAYIAEYDDRQLYRPAGYRSMYEYCVERLHLSEDAAYKRIHAARAALRFPGIFDAVANGQLHLAGVCMLAPHLTPENADELVTAAAFKSKARIDHLLAERFPRPELPTLLAPIPVVSPVSVGSLATAAGVVTEGADVRTTTCQLAPGQVAHGIPRAKVAPLAPQQYGLQVTIRRSTHDKLRYAQELLGHEVPAGDIEQVLERGLDALIEKLEKRKFAATDKPRSGAPRRSANPRHIPAHVKRAVRTRDGGQCTFVSDDGHRCRARSSLEFDHETPVARGGEATVANIRLRCRAHNQYEAECVFGVGFMSDKREAARARRASPSASIAG